jgi:hypothetical protein
METDNTNQQVSPQAPLPIPSNHSKIFIIALSIALIVAVSIGGFILGTRKNQITPTPTAQTTTTPIDETANWKTYINDKLGITIKIPPNFPQFEETIEGIRLKDSYKVLLIYVSEASAGVNRDGSILPLTKENLLSFCKYSDNAQRLEIQERPAVRCEELNVKWTNPNLTGHIINYWILDGNRKINLHFTIYDDTKMSLEILDQILSTFQFSN